MLQPGFKTTLAYITFNGIGLVSHSTPGTVQSNGIDNQNVVRNELSLTPNGNNSLTEGKERVSFSKHCHWSTSLGAVTPITILGLWVCSITPRFMSSFIDSNPRSHPCAASALSTEPPPHSSFFMSNRCKQKTLQITDTPKSQH